MKIDPLLTKTKKLLVSLMANETINMSETISHFCQTKTTLSYM